MAITCSPLPQNNGNLPVPFLVVISQLFSWIIFINDCICILTGSLGQFLHNSICYTKIEGNKNSPDSLNARLNYHYHSENRVIAR